LGDANVTLAFEGMQRRADEAPLLLLDDGRIGHVVGDENAVVAWQPGEGRISALVPRLARLIRAQRVDRSHAHAAARRHVRRDRRDDEQHERRDRECPGIERLDAEEEPHQQVRQHG
jgi:hypothetical protein